MLTANRIEGYPQSMTLIFLRTAVLTRLGAMTIMVRATVAQLFVGLWVLSQTNPPPSSRAAAALFAVMGLCVTLLLDMRNNQLIGEKERLEWEVTKGYPDRDKIFTLASGGGIGTLGNLQDQKETDDAISCAFSVDHEPSLVSSLMLTVEEAAAKDITRAPPPPKRKAVGKVHSDPGVPNKNLPLRLPRVLPEIERPAAREEC